MQKPFKDSSVGGCLLPGTPHAACCSSSAEMSLLNHSEFLLHLETQRSELPGLKRLVLRKLYMQLNQLSAEHIDLKKVIACFGLTW